MCDICVRFTRCYTVVTSQRATSHGTGAPLRRGYSCYLSVQRTLQLRQNARDDPERQYTQRDAGDANEGVLYEQGSNTCDGDTCHGLLD